MIKLPTKKEMLDTLRERHGNELQEKFWNSSVAICGLGGLGSAIAIALTRAGIGKLHLIDYDLVDISNLHRQQYFASQIGMYKTDALYDNLRKISPYIEINIHTDRITRKNCKEFLEKDDVVCEAFDSPKEKAMLVNCVMENFPKKYLVAGSGMAGLSSANDIKTRQVTKYFYICGDESSDVSTGVGLLSSRVMVCAAHQAHMVLRIIAGRLET